MKGERVLKTKKGYEKPIIKKEETMNFPVEIINSLGDEAVCRQCSSCHGCR
jgi:hypothetical protein